MGEAAGLFAKLAGAVFFGKAAPDGLLGVLLEAPYPTEYDPCLAPSYREAAGYLVAAYWVLTGGDPKLLDKWLWASAVESLGHLAFFAPTQEAIAAVFLARAGVRALEAAQDPDLRGAAALLAKVAGAVFLGMASPDALLGVLLASPPPTEYDTFFAPHYREAAGYLVAAYWVLTGGDPKRLSRWFWPWRWERTDAEAILLELLGRPKMNRVLDHLYLGDLPF